MKYESIIKPATTVDYSTLFTILDETIKDIYDPINLFNNIHVYTQAVSKIRTVFLEPFLKQLIRNTPPILNAIALRQNLYLNYKQFTYIVLNISNPTIINWINTVKDDNVPNSEYIKDAAIYKAITLLNATTHDSQNSYIRTQFVDCFYHCFEIYIRVFPNQTLPINFSGYVSVEKYMSNSLKAMITYREEEYNSMLTTLKNIEKQNDERAKELKEYTNTITEQRVLIENLQVIKMDYEKRIGTLQNSIANYINLKEIWDKKLDEEYVEPLIRTTTLNKIEAWKEYDLFKNERMKLNEKLKLLI